MKPYPYREEEVVYENNFARESSMKNARIHEGCLKTFSPFGIIKICVRLAEQAYRKPQSSRCASRELRDRLPSSIR